MKPSLSPPPADAATPHVEVRHSPVHGHGVFALRALKKRATVGLYAGRRYTARQAARAHWDHSLTYLFGLSDGTTIDGAQGGNATRHLNHACEPNCEAVEVEDPAGGPMQLRIETLRRIAPGEELFIDYALTADDDADPADYRCLCGAAACRGTMLGPRE